jgi:hypothetical protein
MPEVIVDDRDWEQYRQCEIRQPTLRGYLFHILWILAGIQDGRGGSWTIAETWGIKKMPTPRSV